MVDDVDRFPDESWVEFVGPWESGDPPVGARGWAHYYAPMEGGYLVSLEGGGSGFFEQESLRLLGPGAGHDSVEDTIWVSPAPPIPSDEWDVHVGGCFGRVAGRYPNLEMAIEEARRIAAAEGLELVWVSSDCRRIAGRARP